MCTDVNECLINNGGCSLNPRVQCVNTRVCRNYINIKIFNLNLKCNRWLLVTWNTWWISTQLMFFNNCITVQIILNTMKTLITHFFYYFVPFLYYIKLIKSKQKYNFKNSLKRNKLFLLCIIFFILYVLFKFSSTVTHIIEYFMFDTFYSEYLR